jgi:pSer/pThr/pTyr-binding forkhead associated (FHA) protein
MWALRVLTGPQAGLVFDLKMGRNLIGRAQNCDIKLMSLGVSKEHSEITVFKEKIVITDLRSSNGTFLNGVRIQNGIIRLGDKLGIHDVLIDLIPAQETRAPVPRVNTSTTGIGVPPPMPYYGGGAAPNLGVPLPQPMASSSAPAPLPAPAYSPGGVEALKVKVEEYIEKVALPGVYKLPKLVEFRIVILGFVVLFIFVTTLLSMIPMVQITRTSIITESKRRAASIARTLATINQSALIQNSYSSLSTNAAETEEGVSQVMIVQQSDGMILTPASRAGTTPDLPFVHSARREMRPQTVQVDSNTIGASFPIGLFDPNTGEQSVKAHAIVMYDIGSLAFDDGRALSLFFQTLLIATVIGFLIYFFMYKLIEYPISLLNAQLDIALREKKDHTEVEFQFPALQALIGNINSLLSRYVHGDGDKSGNPSGSFFNKDGEAENLVQIIGFPCVAISREGRIIACNAAFNQVARSESGQLAGQSVKQIPDTALQQNLEGLISKSRDNPRMIHTDQLEFSGHLCVLSCQAFSSNGTDVDYFVVAVSPTEGGG